MTPEQFKESIDVLHDIYGGIGMVFVANVILVLCAFFKK